MNPVRATSMYYVYGLRNNDGRVYTGHSGDLQKRLSQHKNGHSAYTRSRVPYESMYYEARKDAHDARARERYLKTGMGKRYLHNRVKRFLALTG